MENRTRHPLAVALLVVFILCSGWLAATQSVSGQPTQEPTDIPSRVTPEPTREPTAEPTTAPRPTREPTAEPTTPPLPTREPTTEPIDPNPPVTVSPTELVPPAPPPTVMSNDGGDSHPPTDASYGHLTVTTRVCPPEFDTALAWDLDAIQQQCTGVLPKAGHSIRMSPVPLSAFVFKEEFGGEGVTFVVTPGLRWLSGSVQTPPSSGIPYEHLTVACTTPPDTTAGFAALFYSYKVALVEIKMQQTTTCTRYVHLPVATGTVTAHVWQCAAGYDWTAPTSNPGTDCTQPADGLKVYSWPGGEWKGYIYGGYSGDAGPGTVTITSLIPGPYALMTRFEPQGTNPDWLILRACGSDTVAEQVNPGPGEPPVTNLVVPSGGTVECNVYLVPPTAASAAPETASLPNTRLAT